MIIILEWLHPFLLLLFIIEVIKLAAIFLNRKKISKESISDFPFVSIIIPARNEEKRIALSLKSIGKQNYPSEKLEIIVVDDSSTDQTAQIIDSFRSRIPNLIALEAGPLPEGWSGKSHACHTGSLKSRGEYFCFIDADVKAQPDRLKEAIAFAGKNDPDVLSLIPRQEAVSLFEKILLLPVLTMVGSTARKDHIILNGQFMLFKKNTYQAIGGHSIVKNTVAEDLDFAIFFKDKHFSL